MLYRTAWNPLFQYCGHFFNFIFCLLPCGMVCVMSSIHVPLCLCPCWSHCSEAGSSQNWLICIFYDSESMKSFPTGSHCMRPKVVLSFSLQLNTIDIFFIYYSHVYVLFICLPFCSPLDYNLLNSDTQLALLICCVSNTSTP